MEPFGTFPNGESDFFRKMFASEDCEFYSQQFLDQNSSFILLGENDGLNNETQSTFCSNEIGDENEHVFYSIDHVHHHTSNLQYISQENSYNSNCSTNDDTNYYFSYPHDQVLLENNTISMDFCMDENFFASFVTPLNEIIMEENVKLNEDCDDHIFEKNDYNTQIMEHVEFHTNHEQLQMHLKRKLDAIQAEVPVEEKINNKSKNPKKKPRVSNDVKGCMKISSRSKKLEKVICNNEEEIKEKINNNNNNKGSNGNSSSSNISEDDNNSCQENSTLNSNGKTRASRGSATDPQSLYARKRRERINEQLRILQNLVPNGTKVDISTMLEEAVNYVKFLQTQIKLLSSDDMWMYAPLAYNGFDIGLNLNLKSSSSL